VARTMAKMGFKNSIVVLYHNDFHKINISNLGVLENNLLFSIFKKLSLTDEVSLDIHKLNDMIYERQRKIRVKEVKDIAENLYKNFFGLNFQIIYPKSVKFIHLFSTMELTYADEEKNELSGLNIKINPDFKYLLQEISYQFTAFSLLEFKSLKSRYSKTIFRLLSQYSGTGVWRINYNSFCGLLGVPLYYNFALVNYRIIKPSVKEISQFIDNLNVRFVKERGDDGKLRVSVIEFKFKPFKAQKNSDKELLALDNAKRYVKRDIIANKAKNRPNDDNHILLDKLTEKMVKL
jgi:plasmid replication initiation protein